MAKRHMAMALAILAFSGLSLSDASAGAMNGRPSCSDRYCKGINAPSYGKWSCTSLRGTCLRRNAGSPQCGVAYSNCMQTGTFAGPRGTIHHVARL
jgi:hypothetical protein